MKYHLSADQVWWNPNEEIRVISHLMTKNINSLNPCPELYVFYQNRYERMAPNPGNRYDLYSGLKAISVSEFIAWIELTEADLIT